MRQHSYTSLTALACTLGLIVSAAPTRAANLISTSSQAAGANWTAAIWKTNGTGSAVGLGIPADPGPGNTYALAPNATVPVIAVNVNNCRLRTPIVSGQQTYIFPGDSLTVATNTEIRFKIANSTATTINFPGVNGNPGLIVDGGFLGMTDGGNTYTISGILQVPSWCFINLSDNNGTLPSSARACNLAAQLTGNGTVALIQTSQTNSVLTISCPTNTFTGKWYVTSGTLYASGNASLGTNSITIDPYAPLALNTFNTFPVVSPPPHPAVINFGYDVDSAGTLTVTNGGLINLHQNCYFTAVVIEGTALSAGTHPYSELAASFPNNFVAGGGGNITVQTYTLLGPSINAQPAPVLIYPGETAHFSVTATAPQGSLAYAWRTNGTALSDGGGISGSATATLTVANVSSANVGDYDVVVTHSLGSVTSIVATLSLATPTGEAYETAILTNKPWAYWQLNELGDPFTNAPAFDYVGGFNGTYGVSVLNGNGNYNIVGPQTADGFPGFGSANLGAEFFHFAGSYVSAAPLNLNTNTVTITAWINPQLPHASDAILFCRGGGTVAGFRYSSATDINGNYTLAYNWSDLSGSVNFNSGIVPPLNQWSFVALVITPTNATIYLLNTNTIMSASNPLNHPSLSFGGPTTIGWDTVGGAGSRAYTGYMDEVAVFNRSLSQAELVNLYAVASGGAVPNVAPSIFVEPADVTRYVSQTAQFTVSASGYPAVRYQWQVQTNGDYVNLSDGGQISGSTTAILTISNLVAANGTNYVVVVTNDVGSVTSRVAVLTVQPLGPPLHITLSVAEVIGENWDTPGRWSDGNAASYSAWMNPGSAYEVLPGAMLRSPVASANVFPGDQLTISGSGVFELNANGAGTLTNIGELKLKTQGTEFYKKLVMNGGQIDTVAIVSGMAVLGGEVDILANTPIYDDNSSQDDGLVITAWLTGSGTIQYAGPGCATGTFRPAFGLNIAGNTNSFSGQWNVVAGMLLGTGTNSLGTNNITIGPIAALETTYDIQNPQGSLFLNGMMYLHQNDHFTNVVIGGVALGSGIYSFAQLNAAYPAYFPATWTPTAGSAFSTGSGSITVGNGLSPVTLYLTRSGANLQLTWANGALLEATNITGPWVTNLTATSPFLVSPTNAQMFFRVQTQ